MSGNARQSQFGSASIQRCEGALGWKEEAMRLDNAIVHGEVLGQAEPDERILTFHIPDDAVRAGCERRTESVHLGILH
jgi:hypothetical protein